MHHADALRRLCDPRCVRWVGRGRSLMEPGAPCEHLCLVLRGLVKLYAIREDGSLHIIRFTHPLDVLGLPSALAGRFPHHYAATVTESKIAFLPRVQTLARIRSDPDALSAAFEVLATTIGQLCEQGTLPREHGCERYVASALWHLFSRIGIPDESGPVTLALTHQEIADFLCLHRVSVTRALTGLARRGWVRCGTRALEILDPASLGEFSQPHQFDRL